MSIPLHYSFTEGNLPVTPVDMPTVTLLRSRLEDFRDAYVELAEFAGEVTGKGRGVTPYDLDVWLRHRDEDSHKYGPTSYYDCCDEADW